MWNPGVGGGKGGLMGTWGGSRSYGQSPKNSELVEQPFRHPVGQHLQSRHNKASTSALWAFHGRAFICVSVCVFKLEDPSLNSAKRRNDDQTQDTQERKKKGGAARRPFFVCFNQMSNKVS